MPWPRVRLGDVLDYVSRPLRVVPNEEYREIGIRSHGKGIFHKQRVSGSALGSKRVFFVEPGDFILNIVFAWEGAVAVVSEGEAGMIGSHRFPTFRADERRLDTRFLFLYFRTGEGLTKLLRVSPGGAGRNRTLSRAAFLNLEVPLPPLTEQRDVVARVDMLEHQLRDANELRALSDAMITTLWERASEQRIRALGDLRLLASLVDVQGGGTPSKSNPAYWIGDIPWVSPKDMKRWEITDAEDHISLEATTESPAKLVQPGAVLIVTRGMILARNVPVARLAVKAAINQDMKALHARDSIDAEYILIALRALNRDLLALVAKSSHDTRKLETSKLLAYEIPLPSLTDQQAIVRDLKLLRDRIEEALGQAQASRDDLRVLPRRILSEAFRPA